MNNTILIPLFLGWLYAGMMVLFEYWISQAEVEPVSRWMVNDD